MRFLTNNTYDLAHKDASKNSHGPEKSFILTQFHCPHLYSKGIRQSGHASCSNNSKEPAQKNQITCISSMVVTMAAQEWDNDNILALAFVISALVCFVWVRTSFPINNVFL